MGPGSIPRTVKPSLPTGDGARLNDRLCPASLPCFFFLGGGGGGAVIPWLGIEPKLWH